MAIWDIKKPLQVTVKKPKVVIAKKDISLKGVAKGGLNVWSASLEHMISLPVLIDENLLNNNLDKYSSGLLSDSKNAASFGRELGQGKAVDDNLKSAARVGIVAAATVAAPGAGSAVGAFLTTSSLTAGLSQKSWGEVIATSAQIFATPDIASIVKGIVIPRPQGATNETYYTPTSPADNFTYENNTTLLIIIGVTVMAAVLLTAKKKRK